MFIMAGLALDVANAHRFRTHLQVASDSAAHAALVAREFESASNARQVALGIADVTLPAARYGNVLRPADIQFGYWDPASRTFTADDTSDSAVMVESGRADDRGNAVDTYLLKLAGFDAWDIRRQSIFETYLPTCLEEGFAGEDIVYTTTGNYYTAGFCIHSNTAVGFNNDNSFEPGVIVSMPDRRNVILPSTGLDTNLGLAEALRDGYYDLRILSRIQHIVDGIRDPLSIHFRDWIVIGASEIDLPRNGKLDSTVFQSGRIHTISCTSASQSANIHADTVLRDLVIITNCRLNFGENVALEDVTVVNTNTSANSFGGASGIRLGRDDNCAEGGGAQLVSLGGANFPQALQFYGSQILALGDVSFTADANGVEGVSIISGGRIDGTTDSVMGFCDGAGMEDNFALRYYRLAY